MADQDLKIIRARCSCGSIQYTLSVPKASLPLSAFMCNCTICRTTSGAPCVFHYFLQNGLKPKFIEPSTEDNLSKYGVNGTRTGDFCSTCGCHVAGVALDRNIWVISTSLFADHGSENVIFEKRLFSKSSKDGGFAGLISRMGGRKLVDWNPDDGQPAAEVVVPEAEVGPDGKERLRIECHCKGVSFTVPRPSEEMLKDELLSKFIDPRDKTRWAAQFCTCDDCRLTTGCHAVGWACLRPEICEPAIGQDLKIGTSKTFASSPGVLRSFCGDCGATLFYSRRNLDAPEEPPFVGLAIGAMRAPEGYLAQKWLGWSSSVLHLSDMEQYDKEFAEAIKDGVKTLAA